MCDLLFSATRQAYILVQLYLGTRTQLRLGMVRCWVPCAVKILGSKRIGVTTLTFQGHVTSSVT